MRKILFSLLLFSFIIQAVAQQTITGVVTDKNEGTPIPGATITVKGTSVASLSDLDGKYTLTAPSDATLLVSFFGYQTKEIAINGQSVINIEMVAEEQAIDEVVVIGYGTQKKSLVTGAISKVDGEEIAKGTNLRVTQAIQGKTAGVVISNNSGQPGEFITIRVRGTGTNGDAEPLYIVDGLPTNGYGIDYLSSSDIESIEVLKDAASAAIYGARGANGVVLISTKKGKKGTKTQVTYDGYYGLQNPLKKIGVLGKDDYIMIINEMAINAGQAPKFNQAMIDTLTDTDWQEEMFNMNAPKMNHTISFTGGSDKLAYASSLSYFEQDGIVAKGKSHFDRLNYRLNTTADFGLLELGATFNFANLNNNGIAANDQYAGNSLIQALNTPPIVPVYMSDGSFGTPEKFGIGMQEITNPIAMLSYQNSRTRTNKLIGGFYAEFDIGELIPVLKGLKYKSSYGTEFALVSYNSYTPIYDLDATHKSIINTVNASEHKYFRWNFENILTYNKTFGESNISVLLGHAAFKEWDENIGGSKSDVIFDEFGKAYLSNATDPESANIYGALNEHTVLSYFGRINYDYANKYMISATLRADGSSRFGPENKFGYFPSVSVGWVLSRENFMEFMTQIVSFAKLRGSWGQNGNENIGNFRYTSVMANGSIYYFGLNKIQYNGVQPSSIANPLLKWETSEQTNFGLDLQFLNNRISFTADYYIKKTKDWLVQAPAPLMLGNVAPVINGGDVQNSGFELELGFRQNIGEFKFDVSLTGAFNKNEVLNIENEEKKLTGGTGGHGQSGILVAEVGKPMGYFSGYETEGIFQTNEQLLSHSLAQPNAKLGDVIFKDQNNDNKLDDADRVMLGDPTPDFTGGINLTAEWKGIDIGMFWYAAIGHQIWNATRRYDLNYTNYTYAVLDRWTGPYTSNDFPRVTLSDLNNNWKTPSDLFVEDADFLKLKNLTVGYTLPTKISKFVKISRIRIYLAAENLFTFTKYNGYEPEIGGGIFGQGIDHGVYPQARTFMSGINITF